jgi:hypothetical protein
MGGVSLFYPLVSTFKNTGGDHVRQPQKPSAPPLKSNFNPQSPAHGFKKVYDTSSDPPAKGKRSIQLNFNQSTRFKTPLTEVRKKSELCETIKRTNPKPVPTPNGTMRQAADRQAYLESLAKDMQKAYRKPQKQTVETDQKQPLTKRFNRNIKPS